MELFVTLAIKDTAYKQGLKDAEGNASSSTSKIGGAFKAVGKVAKTAMVAALPPPLHYKNINRCRDEFRQRNVSGSGHNGNNRR